mgnify:CR=1 FL=1
MGHIKIQRIFDFGLISSVSCPQRWCNRVLDALPIHILIVVARLGRPNNYILPYPLKLRCS